MLAQPKNLNDALSLFARIADAQGKTYDALAYRRVIALGEDAAGTKIARKIREFRATGHISELNSLLANPQIRARLDFDRILGFGPATIDRAISAQLLTRDDIMRAAHRGTWHLTHIQELGLRHFDDLQKSIPREMVTNVSASIFAEILRAFDNIEQSHENVVLTIAGSYRRCANQSNDIDILICAPAQIDDIRAHNIMREISRRIGERTQYIDTIALGSKKFSFLWRDRWVISIDLILVESAHYYSALLYFTGSQLFNIWLRELCQLRGFSLNQYGLKRVSDGEIIALISEEHIFELLSIPYVEPCGRNNAPVH